MKFTGIAVLVAGVVLTVGTAQAPALDVAPAPSAAFGEGGAPLLPPVIGIDELAAAPVLCAVACEESASEAYADCNGCLGHNQMKWEDHWQWEYVQIGYSKNTAKETISRQNLHAALISSASNKCYEGSQRFTQNVGDHYSFTDSPVISSGQYKAWDDKWTLASGHLWYEDGVTWTINGEIDICKQF